jgi:hypothetical protein
MENTSPKQLKVAFVSPYFSGHELFPKTPAGEKNAEAFLKRLQKNHKDWQRKHEASCKLKVQITTV